MAFPIRMNPVEIIIQQLSVTQTAFDGDFLEPIGKVGKSDPVTLSGQVNFGPARRFEELQRTITGDSSRTFGTLVFRKSDIDASGITFKKGDRVISVAGQTTDLEIVRIQPMAPLNGDFLLIELEVQQFRDTNESFT